MSIYRNFRSASAAALLVLLCRAPALAGTFVYVSSAEDGDIGVYSLQPDGSLQPGARAAAAKIVMPLAASPDRRFLNAGARPKPLSAYTYANDKKSGALRQVPHGPLHQGLRYIPASLADSCRGGETSP